MKILSIDVGSYSVKFLETKLERKQLVLLDNHEVIIDQVRGQFPPETEIHEIQCEIIQNYFSEALPDGKIIYQLQNDMITTRYLEIPVANKKKAEMMIPFQLEENLPYPSSAIHYISDLKKNNNQMNALINVAQTDVFDEIYHQLEAKQILPAVLTSELFAIQSFIDQKQITGAICILDIGHNTTKAYFANDGHIVSNHTSHIAGRLVDEVISHTYQIDNNEAILYKHQNCFLLTESQYAEVDKDQQDFAKLMRQTFWPLILDIKRWELGFRVKNGQPVEKVYLMGGSSNINNIENFFSQSLSIRTEFVDLVNELVQYDIEFEDDDGDNYNMAYLLANTQNSKTPPANFLTGNYASDFSQNIPIHSTAFIMTRVLMVSLLIIISLVLERTLFLNDELKKVNKKVTRVLKNKTLELTPKQSRTFKRKPDRALKFLTKKNRLVSQEVKTIMSATRINAMGPLAKVSQILSSNKNIDLALFSSDGEFSELEFIAKEPRELEALKKHLSKSSFNNSKIEHKDGSKVLKFSFEGI